MVGYIPCKINTSSISKDLNPGLTGEKIWEQWWILGTTFLENFLIARKDFQFFFGRKF